MSYLLMINFIVEVSIDFPINMDVLQNTYPDESRLEVVYEFIKYLHTEKLLCRETLETAISFEAASTHADLVKRAIDEKHAAYTLKLLLWCNYLYKNKNHYIAIVSRTLRFMEKANDKTFRSLELAIDKLHDSNFITLESIQLLITEQSKYVPKIEGLILLRDHGNLYHFIQGSEFSFNKYCGKHTPLLKFLSDKNCLTQEVVEQIFRIRKNNEPLTSHQVEFIYKWLVFISNFLPDLLINPFSLDYVLSILCVDQIERLSIPSFFKRFVPNVGLSDEAWQRLDNYSAVLFANHRTKNTFVKTKEFFETLKALRCHNMDDAEMIEATIHYLICSMNAFFKRKNHQNEINLIVKLISVLTKDKALVKRFLLSEKIGENNWFYFGKLHLLPGPDKELAKRLFQNNITIELFLDENITIEKTADIYQVFFVFQGNAPELITDDMYQRLMVIDNFNAINDLIKLPVLSRNLPQTINNVLSHHQCFLAANGETLPILHDIPDHVFTTELCNRLFEMCTQTEHTLEEKRTNITTELRRVHNLPNARAGRQPRQDRLLDINREQNTHTASVHLGTDITVWLLSASSKKMPEGALQNYANDLKRKISQYKEQPELTVQQRQSLHGLISLCKNTSFMPITKERKAECLTFIDKKGLFDNEPKIGLLRDDLLSSRDQVVRMRFINFIVLLYSEVMSNKTDEISDEDVLNAFLRAAYETVRGSNFDDNGQDNNPLEPNMGICLSGAYNKFCEILSPFSPRILHYHVSPEVVMQRIKIELINHIKLAMNDMYQKRHLEKVSAFVKDIKNTDTATDVYLEFFHVYESAILAIIKHEYSDFMNEDILQEQMGKFKNLVLPYLPSPSDEGANLTITTGFIEWLNELHESVIKTSADTRQRVGFFPGEESINGDDNDDQPQAKRARFS